MPLNCCIQDIVILIKPSTNILISIMHRSVNVTVGELEKRMLITGLHTVVDIFCVGCGSILGWKYVRSSVSFLLSFFTF